MRRTATPRSTSARLIGATFMKLGRVPATSAIMRHPPRTARARSLTGYDVAEITSARLARGWNETRLRRARSASPKDASLRWSAFAARGVRGELRSLQDDFGHELRHARRRDVTALAAELAAVRRDELLHHHEAHPLARLHAIARRSKDLRDGPALIVGVARLTL